MQCTNISGSVEPRRLALAFAYTLKRYSICCVSPVDLGRDFYMCSFFLRTSCTHFMFHVTALTLRDEVCEWSDVLPVEVLLEQRSWLGEFRSVTLFDLWSLWGSCRCVVLKMASTV